MRIPANVREARRNIAHALTGMNTEVMQLPREDRQRLQPITDGCTSIGLSLAVIDRWIQTLADDGQTYS